MEDDPPKAQFFFAESDEDSLGIVDGKSEVPTIPDPTRVGVDIPSVSSFTQEEQAELPNFSDNVQSAATSKYNSERDDEIPAQVSGNYERTSRPANQEACDVPAVLTDEASNDSADFIGVAGDATQSSHVTNDSEDVPIEVVEVDDEPSGEIPDAPLSHDTRVFRRHTSAVTHHLSDISDDEIDQLPRARDKRPEVDGSVDCSGFRSIRRRPSAIPPESPPPGDSFVYGTDVSTFVSQREGQSKSEETNGAPRKPPRQTAGRDRGICRSPPAPPATPPRDDRRARLENLKKLNFPIKYKMKERIDDVACGLSPSNGPSTPSYDTCDGAPRRNVRSFLDEPGAEFLNAQRTERDNSVGRNRSPDAGPRRKRRHDDDGERSDERERNCGGWLDSGERRGVRDDQSSYAEGLDNGLEDLSNNPAELQRRCTAHIALSENQAASVNDDQLLSAVSEALYLLINAQRLCKKREKLLNEMKAMRQGEVDMMKVIHADLPPYLQSVVRIEGDNVFINEAGIYGLGGLTCTASAAQFQQFQPSAVARGIYMSPSTAPNVGMSPFVTPTGIPQMMASQSTVSAATPAPVSGMPVPGAEAPSAALSAPPPARSVSPELDTGTESAVSSSFSNILPSSFSHPPPPISSGSALSGPPHVRPSSPCAAIAGLPDFSKPPPPMRPVNGTSNGSLPKTGSSNALPDVTVTSNRNSAPAPSAATPSTAPPNSAPQLGFNIPPPNTSSGSGTARAPYMQPSSFLGPLPGSSNSTHAQDFTKTITNMITSALKAPTNASMHMFGARSGMRTFGPGTSLMGGPGGPPPSNMHDNSGSSEVEWTNNRSRYQYRGKTGHGKRQMRGVGGIADPASKRDIR